LQVATSQSLDWETQSLPFTHCAHLSPVVVVAQNGVAPEHRLFSVSCPSEVHVDKRDAVSHVAEPGAQRSHWPFALSQSPATGQVTTFWNAVPDGLHVSSTSPVHRKSPSRQALFPAPPVPLASRPPPPRLASDPLVPPLLEASWATLASLPPLALP
jgi:hypothetical protein